MHCLVLVRIGGSCKGRAFLFAGEQGQQPRESLRIDRCLPPGSRIVEWARYFCIFPRGADQCRCPAWGSSCLFLLSSFWACAAEITLTRVLWHRVVLLRVVGGSWLWNSSFCEFLEKCGRMYLRNFACCVNGKESAPNKPVWRTYYAALALFPWCWWDFCVPRRPVDQ